MLSRRMLVAVLAVSLTLCVAGTAAAQGVLEPGNSSALQIIDAEAPVVQSTTTTISRPDFRLMGLAMLWSQLAWLPASPMQMPSALHMVIPGDRRWRLR